MRNNQPVTQEEYDIPQGINLVSKTDLAGTIVDCNDAFEAASGFSRDELIGQPHNMIRHPDVPPAVFADMWQTLKQGLTWSQFVKNRRKDGGYYWVEANATPLFENGKISGYMSVRSAISDTQKSAASQAYKDIASGKAKIEHGNLYYGFQWRKLNPFTKLSLTTNLTLLALVGLLPILATQVFNAGTGYELTGVALLVLSLPLIGLRQERTQKTLRKQMYKLTSGNHVKPLDISPKSSLGKVSNALAATSLAYMATREESASLLDQKNLLQNILDKTNTNVMMADRNHVISYMNQGLKDFFSEKQSLIRSVLPGFDVDHLVGSSIDQFHQHPKHQREMLDKLTEAMTTEISIAGCHLELHVMPITNRTGARTGTLVEWIDRSQDKMIIEEVKHTVEFAKNGILDKRIDLSKVNGVTREVSLAINELLDAIEAPINESVKVGIAMSEGKLTQHITGKSLGRFAVLKDAMNVAVDNLGSMIGQTKQAISSVKEGAGEISHSSIDLNDRTQQQAASIEETAASMEQMTSAVKQNADNAIEATSVTQKSANQASDGVKVMENAIKSMEQVHESSQKINDIIGLIDSIAFQTNLLALNAAVEAARAGEHGRGFAVVAGEVRSLAGKSADAAKEIRMLIEDAVQKVAEGTQHVQNSGDALGGIVESINTVNQIIEEIAASSKEQAEGVGQVNLAITNIDGAVQQNAALVEESAATADHLGNMADAMSSTVSSFVIGDHMTHMFTPAETHGFDFASSRRAHRQWRVKVRAYINHVDVDFDRNTAADGTKCALGQWIYGPGKQVSSLASYKALETAHANLHAFIGSVLDLVDIGDIEKANDEMDKLEAMSLDVIDKITALEKDIALGSGAMTDVDSAPPTKTTKTISAPNTQPSQPKQLETKKSRTPTHTKAESPIQTPAPVQPKQGEDDEWGEF